LLLVSLAMLAAAGCTKLGLNTANSNFADEVPATPAVLEAFEADPAVTTREDWTSRRKPELRQTFEKLVYGPIPTELKGAETGRRVVDANFAGGMGTLEEIDVRVGEGADAPTYRIALALPRGTSAQHPAPLIVAENFCGNQGNLGSMALSAPHAAFTCTDAGFEARVIRLIFGKYITVSPMQQILGRGYAYAGFYPYEIVADQPQQAALDLARLGKQLPKDRAPTGAIAVWAAAFGWSLDVLDKDPRIDARRTASYGHSRHGKAALLAGAIDDRIKAVIAHQSGKGGATLTRSYAGESVKEITTSYPHWFAPAYAAFGKHEPDIAADQHQLIAMIAPRPVLLGNGWKDVWSDPNGSFRAALGADPVYKMMGAQGLLQTGMQDTTHRGDIDFWIRPGGHSVRAVDWDHFLDSLDRWFGKPAQAPDATIHG
jgi:hypothetical protein